jgi:hypothetical protein
MMPKRRLLLPILFIMGMMWLGISGQAGSKEMKLIGPGDPFPEIPLETPIDPKEREYLTLPEAETFTLKDIKAEVVLVELLSVYCHSCKRQVRPYNRLLDLIENDPQTRGRIKMIGIAVGNDDEEVEKFHQKNKVSFPIIPDPQYHLHQAIGGSRTPFTIYVRQDPGGGGGVVVDTHLGTVKRYQKLFAELTNMMGTNLASVRKESGQKQAKTVVIKPVLSESELRDKVMAVFGRFGGAVRQFQEVKLKDDRMVYTGLVEQRGKSRRLFARAVSRLPTCDLCHDIHFIYLFDGSGEVLGFEPIQLSKWGNKPWDEADLAKMRGRLLGRYIFQTYGFDPKVDAVSSATITSGIILDAVFKGETILAELHEQGLI